VQPVSVAERKYEDRDKMAALLLFHRLVCSKANKLLLRIRGLQHSPRGLHPRAQLVINSRLAANSILQRAMTKWIHPSFLPAFARNNATSISYYQLLIKSRLNRIADLSRRH